MSNERTRSSLGLLLLAAWGLGACGSPSPSIDTASIVPQASHDPDSPYQTTREEFSIGLKACLKDEGFNVDVDPYDLSLHFTFGDPREAQRAMEAVPKCRRAVDPSRDVPPPPISDSQLRALYRYLLTKSECLDSAGYPVSPAPPEQVFIDTGGRWNPEIGDVEIPRDVLRQCEENRPDFLDW